jgi:hypothetical protein
LVAFFGRLFRRLLCLRSTFSTGQKCVNNVDQRLAALAEGQTTANSHFVPFTATQAAKKMLQKGDKANDRCKKQREAEKREKDEPEGREM